MLRRHPVLCHPNCRLLVWEPITRPQKADLVEHDRIMNGQLGPASPKRPFARPQAKLILVQGRGNSFGKASRPMMQGPNGQSWVIGISRIGGIPFTRGLGQAYFLAALVGQFPWLSEFGMYSGRLS